MHAREQEHQVIIDAMRACFLPYSEAEESIYDCGVRRKFPNGMRCDLFFYKSVNILRFNRGAWMVKQEPMLGLLFDEVLGVIAKIKIHSVDTIKEKAIPHLITKIANYPSGIGALTT